MKLRKPRYNPTFLPSGGPGSDIAFFAEHPDRHVRIRKPMPTDEHDEEFRTLGDHQRDRRRIIVFRGSQGRFPRIPFLLAADETIEDTDDVLRLILKELMEEAAQAYGLPVPGAS